MRLYKKLKPLISGSQASQNNKGLLVLNSSILPTLRPFLVNIVNTDGTVTGITLGAGSDNLAGGFITQFYPNYSIIPFQISSWTDLSGVTLSGFELF
jgi:hypothetical protein